MFYCLCSGKWIIPHVPWALVFTHAALALCHWWVVMLSYSLQYSAVQARIPFQSLHPCLSSALLFKSPFRSFAGSLSLIIPIQFLHDPLQCYCYELQVQDKIKVNQSLYHTLQWPASDLCYVTVYGPSVYSSLRSMGGKWNFGGDNKFFGGEISPPKASGINPVWTSVKYNDYVSCGHVRFLVLMFLKVLCNQYVFWSKVFVYTRLTVLYVCSFTIRLLK